MPHGAWTFAVFVERFVAHAVPGAASRERFTPLDRF